MMQCIFLIVAMSENRVIGKDHQLPWHLPADLKHFKSITMGKPILMGRKTFESIGRALPGRLNVVITRDPGYEATGCVVANSIDAALKAVSLSDEVFFIGGAELYKQILPNADRIYLTTVKHTFEGDAFFPELNLLEWNEISRQDFEADKENLYGYSFILLERRKLTR